MHHVNSDPRSLQSAGLLYQGLIELLDNKPFRAITVSDLVRQAQIGRTTFYRHFDTIEDILAWRCSKAIDELKQFTHDYFELNPVPTTIPLLKPILLFFERDSELVEVLIKAERTHLLQHALPKLARSSFSDIQKLLDIPEAYLDYWAEMTSALAVQCVVHWVHMGKQPPPDELADGLLHIGTHIMPIVERLMIKHAQDTQIAER